MSTINQSAAALNAVTQTLRDEQSPMVQPAAAAPVAHKVPRRLSTVGVDAATEKNCASFVREFSAAMLKADKALATAQSLAVAFVSRVFYTAPTYESYMEVRNELRAQCEIGHGAHTFDTVRKAYAAAIVSTFGTLPESKSPEAQRKAAARAKAAAKVGRPTGTTGTDAKATAGATVPAHETIGQFIAKFGAAAVLVELAAILATEKATAADAVVLVDIAHHYKKAA